MSNFLKHSWTDAEKRTKRIKRTNLTHLGKWDWKCFFGRVRWWSIRNISRLHTRLLDWWLTRFRLVILDHTIHFLTQNSPHITPKCLGLQIIKQIDLRSSDSDRDLSTDSLSCRFEVPWVQSAFDRLSADPRCEEFLSEVNRRLRWVREESRRTSVNWF